MKHLAFVLGVPYRTCQDWLHGKRTPTSAAQALIARLEERE